MWEPLTIVLSIVLAAVLAVTAMFGVNVRSAHYRRLSTMIDSAETGQGARVAINNSATPDFSKRLVSIPSFLASEPFAELKSQCTRLVSAERSFIPTHKKGGTVAYETIVQEAPGIVAFYHAPVLRKFVSQVVGIGVEPTPLHDQSSLSVLFYDRPGDHIGWHYDHNFYRGRHFTVLLPLVNEGHATEGLSSAQLMAWLDEREIVLPTPPNTLVVFEGAKVLHRVTPVAEGERRMVLSMTFASDPRSGPLRGAARRIKDTAFFGIRALWT